MTLESDWIVRHQVGAGELVHPDAICEVVCSPDGRWLACLLKGGQGVVWERLGGRKHLEREDGKHLAFSHDSKHLFWQQDTHVEVVALETGQSVRKIGPVEHLEHIALSPSGRCLALATQKEILVGEWQTGAMLQRIPVSKENAWVVRIAFADENRLVSAEAIKERGWVQFVIWEVSTGKVLVEIPETREPEGKPLSGTDRRFTLSHDGYYLASRTADVHNVRVWRTSDGAVVRDIAVEGRFVGAWAFSPDGEKLVLADGFTLGVYPIEMGEREVSLKAREPDPGQYEGGQLQGLTFTPSGDQLLAGGSDGRVYAWNLPGWEEATAAASGGHRTGLLQLLPFNNECVLCRSSDPELRLLALDLGVELVWNEASVGLESLVYDADTGQVVGVRRTDPSVVVDEQQDRITVQTWKAAGTRDEERHYALELPEQVWQPVLALSPDGQWLAGGGNDQSVRVWSLETGEKILDVSLFNPGESQVATPFEDDNDTIAIDWWPGTPLLAVRRMSDLRVDLVDIETGTRLFAVAELGSSPVFIVFLPGTTKFLFADYDTAGLALYDLATGQSTMLESLGLLTALAALPNGQHVALGLKDKVALYDVESRAVVEELAFPFGGITALSVTPDGKKLIAGGEHGQLVIWERQ